mgnify:CR=1 FL=1
MKKNQKKYFSHPQNLKHGRLVSLLDIDREQGLFVLDGEVGYFAEALVTLCASFKKFCLGYLGHVHRIELKRVILNPCLAASELAIGVALLHFGVWLAVGIICPLPLGHLFLGLLSDNRRPAAAHEAALLGHVNTVRDDNKIFPLSTGVLVSESINGPRGLSAKGGPPVLIHLHGPLSGISFKRLGHSGDVRFDRADARVHASRSGNLTGVNGARSGILVAVMDDLPGASKFHKKYFFEIQLIFFNMKKKNYKKIEKKNLTLSGISPLAQHRDELTNIVNFDDNCHFAVVNDHAVLGINPLIGAIEGTVMGEILHGIFDFDFFLSIFLCDTTNVLVLVFCFLNL